MRRLLFTAMLGFAVWAGVARAEDAGVPDCGETLSRSVAKTIYDIRTGAAKLEDKVAGLDVAASQCPGNAFALHYASLAHFSRANQLNQVNAGAEAIGAEVSRAFDDSQAYWSLENRNQTYPVNTGVRVEQVGIPTSEPGDLRKDIMTALLELRAKAGLTHPFITGDAPATTCSHAYFYDVLAISSWLLNNPDPAGQVLDFAGRLGDACPLNAPDKALTDSLLQKSLVDIRLRVAGKIVETDPDKARELVAQIKAYRDATLKPGETSNYNWSEYSASSLSEIEAKLPAIISVPTGQDDDLESAGPVPVEGWFQDGSDPSKVRDSIGRTINAYVAARGIQGFVSALGKMYVVTTHAPDPRAARMALYSAVHGYDKGDWRTSDTKDVDILDATYQWLKDMED